MRTESIQAMKIAEALGAKYDKIAKDIWGNREILAPVLGFCVEELAGQSVESIMRLIDAESISDDVPVSDLPAEVAKQLTEMTSPTERPILFDYRFFVKNPKLSTKDILVRLHILYEIQNKFRPTDSDGRTYLVEPRGIYYNSRELSSQLGRVTEKTNYRDLEKVISIWVVSEDVPKKLQNTASRYKMVKEDFIGTADIPKELYDKSEVIVIRRGENGKMVAPLFEYLDAVFEADIDAMDKFTPASANPEIVKEVSEMPGMGQAILDRGISIGEERGINIGRSEGRTEGRKEGETTFAIRMVKRGKLTVEEAADELNKTIDEIDALLKQVESSDAGENKQDEQPEDAAKTDENAL